MNMTDEHEHDDVGELVDVVTADPQHLLRSAFASAMGALIQALPASYVRDVALAEIIGAHERTEHAIARRRILN
jgi:hypothetical protein